MCSSRIGQKHEFAYNWDKALSDHWWAKNEMARYKANPSNGCLALPDDTLTIWIAKSLPSKRHSSPAGRHDWACLPYTFPSRRSSHELRDPKRIPARRDPQAETKTPGPNPASAPTAERNMQPGQSNAVTRSDLYKAFIASRASGCAMQPSCTRHRWRSHETAIILEKSCEETGGPGRSGRPVARRQEN